MGAYSVRLRESAEKELMALPFPLRRQINHRIVRLKEEPVPVETESLGGGRYRVRLHGHRILYLVDEPAGLVRIIAIR